MLTITRSTIGLTAIMLLIAVTAVVADPISACVNPAGQVRLVADGSACRPQEQLVIWNSEGPEGPEGPAGPQGPQGPAASGLGPALVVDANETVVGHFIEPTGDVLVHIGADYFVAVASQQGFVPAGTFIHRHEECTDTPSVVTVNPDALAQGALVKPGEAWVPDFGAAKIDIPTGSPVFSQVFFLGGKSPCIKGAFSRPVTLTPLRMIPLSAFITPFRLQ